MDTQALILSIQNLEPLDCDPTTEALAQQVLASMADIKDVEQWASRLADDLAKGRD